VLAKRETTKKKKEEKKKAMVMKAVVSVGAKVEVRPARQVDRHCAASAFPCRGSTASRACAGRKG